MVVVTLEQLASELAANPGDGALAQRVFRELEQHQPGPRKTYVVGRQVVRMAMVGNALGVHVEDVGAVFGWKPA